MSGYVVGIDLGQVRDYTALSVVERLEEPERKWDPLRRNYAVRHLERFLLGTTYPVVADRVATIVADPRLRGNCYVVADGTGVGLPVVQLLRQRQPKMHIASVVITGGEAVASQDLDFRVPKRHLVATLQVLLQTGRLKVASAVPDAQLLVDEMLAFESRITPSGNDIYGSWREGSHDDLVLSVALACWYGENKREHRIWAIRHDGPNARLRVR